MPSPSVRAIDAGRPFSWRFTTPLYIGSALNPVNSSMIATALVPIATGLDVPIGQTASLVTALYLASAIAQPTAGKLAAVFGARRVFLAGIVLVLLGGALGGAGPNLAAVLIARVLIGLGTSCAYPSAMMLIQRRAATAGMTKPPGGVLGGLQISALATAALGLPIGGVLVQTVGWRWVFLVNVPVAAIALVAALMWVPRDPAPGAPRSVRGVVSSIDLLGILVFALAMTALLGFLFSLQNPIWLLLAAAVVLFVALTFWELRAASPFLDIHLLVRNASLTRTYLRFALVALCVYVVMYGITQWMEAARGMSALAAGLLLLPMSVISGIVVAPISRRNLVRGPLIVAAVASLVGSVGVLFLTSDSGIGWIVLITVIFGVVLGTASSGNQLALYLQAPAEQLGVASGLFRTFGYLGSIASSAVTGIVFHTEASDAGVHVIGIIMIGVSVVATALTIVDRALRTPDRTAPAA
ncbi:MFS transporter [Microbacterium sp.]|uniref:MFS transporter n=1 Tax=Microbacterium sp. TaxID=51671 RepID=UPI00092837CC|nr:MFS transporter [Microbacterium sp.]MBN9193464.1 MFS transporter [Microbacterium sp.]OJU57554.1 MAG: MFS transporter [Microbacterium sp. 70-38]